MRPRRWLYTIPLRLRSIFRRADVERELDEELRYHLDRLTEHHVSEGMTPEAARIAARRAMDGIEQRKEECRDARGVRLWEETVADFRHGCRALWRDGRFTLVAVVTLALGVGLNAAVFSIVNAVMLRSLPYPQADRLVSLWEETPYTQPSTLHTSGVATGGPSLGSRFSVSAANLVDYRKRSHVFSGLAGFALQARNLTGFGGPDRLFGENVTANFFSLLGVSPAAGRDFVAADDRPDADPVVILADRCWRQRFGGDPGILGRSITLDDRLFQVIGILPRAFTSPGQFGMVEPIEFYVPAAYSAALLSDYGRGDHEINVVGRLKDGTSIEAARAELRVISAALARQFPDSNRGVTVGIAPLRDDLIRNVRTSLLILLGAVALIVLITCVNVANLMLVRATARGRETTLRFALGASRGRVVRQFLVESLVLAAVGCAVGVAVGDVMLRVLTLAAPPGIPRLDTATLDWRVLSVSAAVSTLSAVVFAILPAWHASRTRPADSFKGIGPAAAMPSSVRWRAVLTVAELSISLVLLVAAGLLMKSFAIVEGMDLGFRTENVLAANINLPEPRYGTPAQRLQFFEELERRVAGLPRVESVAFASRMPMRGGWSSGVSLENGDDRVRESGFQAVSAGYFRTMGMALLRGRLFASSDRDGQTPVAVINQAFAKRFFGSADPIGRRLRRGSPAPWITVVGLVNDVRRGGKTADITSQVYLPAAQTGLYPVRLADVAIRTAEEPRALVSALRSAVSSIDKEQPVSNVRTLDEIVDESMRPWRFQMLLLMVFAGVAVALSVTGVFGVLSYAVTTRTTEFGVRVALGARPATLVALVLRQAAVLIAAGVIVGGAGAWALMRYLQALLFEVQPHDTETFALTAGLLAVTALVASVVPAIRAARTDPLVALRYE
jgi:putative ABC transport system permease protein